MDTSGAISGAPGRANCSADSAGPRRARVRLAATAKATSLTRIRRPGHTRTQEAGEFLRFIIPISPAKGIQEGSCDKQEIKYIFQVERGDAKQMNLKLKSTSCSTAVLLIDTNMDQVKSQICRASCGNPLKAIPRMATRFAKDSYESYWGTFGGRFELTSATVNLEQN